MDKAGTTRFTAVTDEIFWGNPQNTHTLITKGIKIQGYYKRNRHFQRYVVSKPLA